MSFLSFGTFAQSNSGQVLTGKWIIKFEESVTLKNNKVVQKSAKKAVPSSDAYVYNFVSKNKVIITNKAGDFQWNFKLYIKGKSLTLSNTDGEAEDDSLLYEFNNGNLVLKRVYENEDGGDDILQDVFYLQKVS